MMMREHITGAEVGMVDGGGVSNAESAPMEALTRRRHPFHGLVVAYFTRYWRNGVFSRVCQRLVPRLEIGVDRDGGTHTLEAMFYGVGRTVLQAEVGAAGFNHEMEPQHGLRRTIESRRWMKSKPVVRWGSVVLVFCKY